MQVIFENWTKSKPYFIDSLLSPNTVHPCTFLPTKNLLVHCVFLLSPPLSFNFSIFPFSFVFPHSVSTPAFLCVSPLSFSDPLWFFLIYYDFSFLPFLHFRVISRFGTSARLFTRNDMTNSRVWYFGNSRAVFFWVILESIGYSWHFLRLFLELS